MRIKIVRTGRRQHLHGSLREERALGDDPGRPVEVDEVGEDGLRRRDAHPLGDGRLSAAREAENGVAETARRLNRQNGKPDKKNNKCDAKTLQRQNGKRKTAETTETAGTTMLRWAPSCSPRGTLGSAAHGLCP